VRTALLILATLGPVLAEDAVYLRRGGELRGTVTATTDTVVVLTMASGEIRLPRKEVAQIRKDLPAAGRSLRRIRRDDWYFLLADDVIVGWARVLHSEQGDRMQVEERRVLFTTRADRRRVEISDGQGAPLEYLWIEATPGRMEVWSGQIRGGEHVRQHRLGGEIETATGAWPKGAVLPLRVRSGAQPARGLLFDPRRGRTQQMVATRAPVADWAGVTLKTSAARVGFAQRAHAPRDARAVAAEALLHPLTPRVEERRLYHVAGGVTLVAPHKRWVDTPVQQGEGKLLTLENRITFARVEIESTPLRDRTISIHESFRRCRTKLGLAYDWFAPVGDPIVKGTSMSQRVEIRQGKERWQGILKVDKRPLRVVVSLALAPLRVWSLERGNLERILESVEAVD
jgi:hypothetical protein